MESFLTNIKLAIFDLDGTLLDSTGIWEDIDKEFFGRRGKEVPPNYSKEIAHIGLLGAAKLTKEKYCPDEEIENILEEWQRESLEQYQHIIGLKPGAKELLEELKSRGIEIGFATANSKSLYGPALARLGIEDYFSFGIDPDVCSSGKESAAMYDLVAAHFGVKPTETLVFEDSLHPSIVASKAGYNVIGIFDKHSTKAINDHKAVCLRFVTSFEELLKELK